MACDICNKKGAPLEVLRDEYSTDEIKDLCSDCVILVNCQMTKIRKLNHGFLKIMIAKFMSEKKQESVTK